MHKVKKKLFCRDYMSDFSEMTRSPKKAIDNSNFDSSSKTPLQNESIASLMLPPKTIPLGKKSSSKKSQFGPSTSKFASPVRQNKINKSSNGFAALVGNGRRIAKNGKVPVGNHSIDRNLTRRRNSVKQIAPKQLVIDRNQQHDLLEMKATEEQKSWLLLKEKLSKSAINAFLKDSSSSKSSNTEAKRKDDDVSLGITLPSISSVLKNESENEGDMSGVESDDNYCNNEWTQRAVKNQTEENKSYDIEMVVQKSNVAQRDESLRTAIERPIQFNPKKRNIEIMHSSQVEMNSSMKFSPKRSGGVEVYSQPMTSRERTFIKATPTRNSFAREKSKLTSIVLSNNSIRASPEKSIANLSARGHRSQNQDEIDQKHEESVEDTRKRSITSLTRYCSQGKKLKLFDQHPGSPHMSQEYSAAKDEMLAQSTRQIHDSQSIKSFARNSSLSESETDTVELFDEPTQTPEKTQSRPIENASQCLYEMFQPLATSTQESKFRPSSKLVAQKSSQKQTQKSFDFKDIAKEETVVSQPNLKTSLPQNSSTHHIERIDKSLLKEKSSESTQRTQNSSQNLAQVVVSLDGSSRGYQLKSKSLTKNSSQQKNEKAESTMAKMSQKTPETSSQPAPVTENLWTRQIEETEPFVLPTKETQSSRSTLNLPTQNSSQNRTAIFVPKGGSTQVKTSKADQSLSSDKANRMTQIVSTTQTVSRQSPPITSLTQISLTRKKATETPISSVVVANGSQKTSISSKRNSSENQSEKFVPLAQPTEARGRFSKNLLAPKSSKNRIEVIESITLPTLANVISEKPSASQNACQKQMPMIKTISPAKTTNRSVPTVQPNEDEQISNSLLQTPLQNRPFHPVGTSTCITQRRQVTVGDFPRNLKEGKSPTRNSSQNQTKIHPPTAAPTEGTFDSLTENSPKNQIALNKPMIPIETETQDYVIISPNEGQKTSNSPTISSQNGTKAALDSMTKNSWENQIPLIESIIPINEAVEDNLITPPYEAPKTSNSQTRNSRVNSYESVTKSTRRRSTKKSMVREEWLTGRSILPQNQGKFSRNLFQKRSKPTLGSQKKSSDSIIESFDIPQRNEGVGTDEVKISDEGMIFDDKGCVFANDDELQAATQFYIENEGLWYMKQEQFKTLSAKRRQKIERELRTIHTMMNSGLEALHSKDDNVSVIDPYKPTMSERVVKITRVKKQRKVQRTATRRVSVTISSEKKGGVTRHLKKVSYVISQRRTSQYSYTNDVTSNSATVQPLSKINKEKTLNSMNPLKTGKFFNKTANAVKTPPHKKAGKMNSRDQENSTELTKPLEKLPVHAETTMTEAKRDSSPVNVNVEHTDPFANDLMQNDPIVNEPLDFNEYQIDNRSETTDIRCDLISCNEHLKDIFCRLSELVQHPAETCNQHGEFLMNFIERLQPIQLQRNAMRTDAAAILNGTIADIQSICDIASTQLEELMNQS